MSIKYTPGPWATFDGDDAFIIMPAGRSGQIATVLKTGANAADASANAYLLNAAPDLLEALKMARQCIAYCRKAHLDVQSGEGIPVEVFIDAALAKAEGEQ